MVPKRDGLASKEGSPLYRHQEKQLCLQALHMLPGRRLWYQIEIHRGDKTLAGKYNLVDIIRRGLWESALRSGSSRVLARDAVVVTGTWGS